MVKAFATLFACTEESLIEQLGHDGKSTFPGSTSQRTHHAQEMVEVAFGYGIALTPIEIFPVSTDGYARFQIFFGAHGDVEANFDRFREHLAATKNGVIQGMREDEHLGHAVYWDGEMCVDSKGRWPLWGDGTNFMPSVLWRATWIT